MIGIGERAARQVVHQGEEISSIVPRVWVIAIISSPYFWIPIKCVQTFIRKGSPLLQKQLTVADSHLKVFSHGSPTATLPKEPPLGMMEQELWPRHCNNQTKAGGDIIIIRIGIQDNE